MPLLFTLRPVRNKNIKLLPDDHFSWIRVLLQISSDEVLQVAGLDAYVYLRFFRMCVKILLVMSLLGLFIMSPLRYLMEGRFDNDDPQLFGSSKNKDHTDPPAFLFVCTVFTYVFTGVVYYFMFHETRHIISTRQKFLGSQKSLIDRTIMISNIPEPMMDAVCLKDHIEELGVGKVDAVHLGKNYTSLKRLFDQRQVLIEAIETLNAQYYGVDVRVLQKYRTPSATLAITRQQRPPGREDIVYSPNIDRGTSSGGGYTTFLSALDEYGQFRKRPEHRKSYFGPKTDSFDAYTRKLIDIDAEIKLVKERSDFPPVSYAFVSMNSVTDAQMAAQAMFSPNPRQLITCLAPAPFDISWESLLLSSKQLFVRRNVIEALCIAFSALLIIPIRYITSLLNLPVIRKLWPQLGKYLTEHEWARTLVCGVLPTYLFSIINSVLPYFISFLCQLEGEVSKSEVELSVVRKNFTYIFFNLFLVFTLFGTISSYKALLTDTTKIAPTLAKSIKTLSLFYIDLIVLQGFTMMPLKLLQVGDICFWIWNCIFRKAEQTPKTYRNQFYKPSLFDIGLNLPQPMMYFVIILIYSVLSTKILVCGLIYFVLGLYVYKYQLVYSMVHPYHSTGKVWPIVFRRVCLGLFFLHLQMFGELVLQTSYVSAGLMVPIFPTTIMALIYFDRTYEPLLHYIALDAIKTEGKSVGPADVDDLEEFVRAKAAPGRGRSDSVVLASGISVESDDENSLLDGTSVTRTRSRLSTIEEEREAEQTYTYPCLLDPMDGPWAGFVGDYIDIMKYRMVTPIAHGQYGAVEQDLEAEQAPELRVTIKRKENSKNEFD